MVAETKLPSPDGQQQRELATNAGTQGVEKFVKLGIHGTSNIHSDIVSGIQWDIIMPRPYLAKIQVMEPGANTKSFVLLPLLLLH